MWSSCWASEHYYEAHGQADASGCSGCRILNVTLDPLFGLHLSKLFFFFQEFHDRVIMEYILVLV